MRRASGVFLDGHLAAGEGFVVVQVRTNKIMAREQADRENDWTNLPDAITEALGKETSPILASRVTWLQPSEMDMHSRQSWLYPSRPGG